MAKDKAFARLPGFRDFPPEDLAIRSHVFESWRRISRRYGFQEYDGPPLEALELYTEKSGEEIVGQLYNFQDKGGREVTLRPEMTPSLARILGDRSRALPKPIRWFTLPQLFRYERQQRGRLREHFQWNVDIVGEAGVGADAEVLAVAIDALRDLGLTARDFQARISDRRLLAAVLRGSGIGEEALPAAFAIVDKLEREEPARSQERLERECALSASRALEVMALFDGPGLEKVVALHGDDPGVAESVAGLEEYVRILSSLGLGDFVQFDLRIVRGLAYYTGIVFELFDRQGELRAICGGGRYDRLLELVGGTHCLPWASAWGTWSSWSFWGSEGFFHPPSGRWTSSWWPSCRSSDPSSWSSRASTGRRAGGWSTACGINRFASNSRRRHPRGPGAW